MSPATALLSLEAFAALVAESASRAPRSWRRGSAPPWSAYDPVHRRTDDIASPRDDGAGAMNASVLELPPERSSPSAARRWVRPIVEGRVEDVEGALLCVSEIVTNAVLHAGTRCEVTVDLTDDRVRIAVRDFAPDRLPVQRALSHDGVDRPWPAHPRGLHERVGRRATREPTRPCGSSWTWANPNKREPERGGGVSRRCRSSRAACATSARRRWRRRP